MKWNKMESGVVLYIKREVVGRQLVKDRRGRVSLRRVCHRTFTFLEGLTCPVKLTSFKNCDVIIINLLILCDIFAILL
jgi:hypothetical protein